MPANATDFTKVLSQTVTRLSETSVSLNNDLGGYGHVLPSVVTITEIIKTLKQLLFPEFFYNNKPSEEAMKHYHIGVDVDRLFSLLQRQIACSLHFKSCNRSCCRWYRVGIGRCGSKDNIGATGA